LIQLGTFLTTLQAAYRTNLPEPELRLWRETLKPYSIGEITAAMEHLMLNPPKYDAGDGTMQAWRGMPKLPDVLETIWDQREKRAQDARRRKQEEQAREMRELEQRRREHPEEFFGMADLVKQMAPHGNSMAPKTEATHETEEQRRELLNRQKQLIAEKYGTEKS